LLKPKVLPSVDERRRSRRRQINRVAKIQFGSGTLPRDCLITDISDGGVRLHVEGFDVPDDFVLLLTGDDVGPLVQLRIGVRNIESASAPASRTDAARRAAARAASTSMTGNSQTLHAQRRRMGYPGTARRFSVKHSVDFCAIDTWFLQLLFESRWIVLTAARGVCKISFPS